MKKLGLAMVLLFSVTAHAETPQELTEQGVKVIESIAADADAAKGDCDKLGSSLAKHQDADAVVMQKIKATEAKLSKDEKAKLKKEQEAKFGARMKAAQGKMGAVAKCKDNAKVKAYGEKVMK